MGGVDVDVGGRQQAQDIAAQPKQFDIPAQAEFRYFGLHSWPQTAIPDDDQHRLRALEAHPGKSIQQVAVAFLRRETPNRDADRARGVASQFGAQRSPPGGSKRSGQLHGVWNHIHLPVEDRFIGSGNACADAKHALRKETHRPKFKPVAQGMGMARIHSGVVQGGNNRQAVQPRRQSAVDVGIGQVRMNEAVIPGANDPRDLPEGFQLEQVTAVQHKHLCPIGFQVGPHRSAAAIVQAQYRRPDAAFLRLLGKRDQQFLRAAVHEGVNYLQDLHITSSTPRAGFQQFEPQWDAPAPIALK